MAAVAGELEKSEQWVIVNDEKGFWMENYCWQAPLYIVDRRRHVLFFITHHVVKGHTDCRYVTFKVCYQGENQDRIGYHYTEPWSKKCMKATSIVLINPILSPFLLCRYLTNVSVWMGA